jgi:hypothetical protein
MPVETRLNEGALMKRFHVHLHVRSLPDSVGFYSRMFDSAPAKLQTDYAKWMLDDPPLNFAISTRGGEPGVDHLGIQADSAEELAALKLRAAAADTALLDEGQTNCCYARSEKHWVTDPQGVAWEHFHTLVDIPVFGVARPGSEATTEAGASVCCAPVAQVAPVAVKAPVAACALPGAAGPVSKAKSCC